MQLWTVCGTIIEDCGSAHGVVETRSKGMPLTSIPSGNVVDSNWTSIQKISTRDNQRLGPVIVIQREVPNLPLREIDAHATLRPQPFPVDSIPYCQIWHGCNKSTSHDQAKAGALGGLVRVSSVKSPTVWQSIGVNLSQPWRMLQLPKLGWIITFLQVPAGPAIPQITPAHAPTDVVVPFDKSLAASVILPEGGVFHQYWVPVLEKYRWARLETANWTVVFLRIPIPAAPARR